jgi:hypothetical protein
MYSVYYEYQLKKEIITQRKIKRDYLFTFKISKNTQKNLNFKIFLTSACTAKEGGEIYNLTTYKH